MRHGAIIGVALTAAALVSSRPGTAHAQDGATLEHGADLRGVWTSAIAPGSGEWTVLTFTETSPALTEWGRARFEASKPQRGPRGVPVAETDDPVYRCFPPGTPRIYLHPFPVEIIQLPGRVMMVFEYDHLIRQIYTDGRAHRTDLAPSWMGDSTGHWEGDTLVIETVGFNDKTWIDRIATPHSEAMRVIERMRVTDEGLLEIDFTVEDPIALVEPWRFRRTYRKTDWTIEELVCMDNETYEPFENAILEYDEQTE